MPRNKFPIGNPGRPKGIKSEKTRLWEQLGDMIVNEGASRALDFLMTCDPETFMKHYVNLLEYFKPKLNRSDITSGDKPIQTPFEGMTFEQLYELKYGRKPDKQ